jgi:hypothetical protein
VWDRHSNQRPWEKVDQLKNVSLSSALLPLKIISLTPIKQSKFLTINHEFWEKRRAAAAEKSRMVDAI